MKFPAVLFELKFDNVLFYVDRIVGKYKEISAGCQLIYVLNNTVELSFSSGSFLLNADDIIFVNSDEAVAFQRKVLLIC